MCTSIMSPVALHVSLPLFCCAGAVLRTLLKDEPGLENAVILVFANKIDLSDVMSNGQLEVRPHNSLLLLYQL